MPARRTILHVDMDAFFAAIVQRDDPSLRGRPILVGGGGPRGVVTTASYEARPFGCRSAMPMAVARRLCPHALVVPVPGPAIRAASEHLFTLLDDFSPLVEPVSVDEAFIDLTGTDRLLGDPVAVAQRLKRRIQDELQLTASVGVATNKFLAKLGSDLNKPDGLTVLLDDATTAATLAPLPVGRIWGVGPASAKRLEILGIRTIGDLLRFSEADLARVTGDTTGHLFRLARGLDDRPVVPDHQAKSIGQEQTFGSNLEAPDDVRAVMLAQAEQVGRRLRKHHLFARGVAVKIRFGDFQTISRSATLPDATDLTDDLWHAARALFDHWAATSFQPVRLIGVTAERLSDTAQDTLFPDPTRARRRALDATLDTIADKFGKRTIHRAGPGD